MRKVTARDLLNEQKRRFLFLSQKERYDSTTEDAKACFRRAPYMGLYHRQDGHGGGRQ